MGNAADYVARGLALVPIPMGQKAPVAKGWNTLEKAITDPQQASTLRGNIGLAHAYSSPPTMALDIDDLPKARVWLSERGVDLDALLMADDAVQVVSGRHGRAKLIYRLPPGLAPLESVAIKEAGWLEGKEKQVTVLEFRCATRDWLTMQDVLPPSNHPETGQPYRWGGKGYWGAIPEIPAELLHAWQNELATHRRKRARRAGRLSLFKGVADTPRQRARLADMLSYVSADCSYERYCEIVWAILSLGWKDGEQLAEQWCRTAPDRFEDASFWNVVNSYDASRTPTMGTIHYHAKAGGWNG
jgi:putative DNA primase/helicase